MLRGVEKGSKMSKKEESKEAETRLCITVGGKKEVKCMNEALRAFQLH